MNKVYATDATDEQWALVEVLIPPVKQGGAPRTVSKAQEGITSLQCK